MVDGEILNALLFYIVPPWGGWGCAGRLHCLARIEAILDLDPTTLIIVDEAERLTINSMEQLPSIFDRAASAWCLSACRELKSVSLGTRNSSLASAIASDIEIFNGNGEGECISNGGQRKLRTVAKMGRRLAVIILYQFCTAEPGEVAFSEFLSLYFL
ncbi:MULTISPECIES: hypothetical protein [Acidobacteriaceae]|uniref:hypothetical protein n=1 Tax=Acidobacteriaceae TaxID=204434 RepID=UPI00131DB575|nr:MULTISPECIES: hypothetical protein [Acidobacteriaceae]MDW5267694.1 hypothetical protein [Edaphobacter sp.]